MVKGIPKTELIVALDFNSVDAAEDVIAALEGMPVIYKIGLELFLAAGSDWIRLLTQSGERVFLDLKFHDIPSTVGQAVLQAANLQAEYLSIHLTGGNAMLDEVHMRLIEIAALKENQKPPLVMGISILSSFAEDDWNATMQKLSASKEVKPIEESVLAFAALAHHHPSINGLICSPHELYDIHARHPDLFLMVAGIRPKGSFRHDQQWIMTPTDAKQNGASAIIVGRPITQAENCREMAISILEELSQTSSEKKTA